MKRDLYWERERDIVSARWDDIIYAYEADNTSGELRSMPKMTDGQVYAAKMNKMKVSCAAQVFSHLKVSFQFSCSDVKLKLYCYRHGSTKFERYRDNFEVL
jgi:hypothetical protein